MTPSITINKISINTLSIIKNVFISVTIEHHVLDTNAVKKLS